MLLLVQVSNERILVDSQRIGGLSSLGRSSTTGSAPWLTDAIKTSGGGSIINMSSTAALIGLSPYFAYSAAKGGIRSLTKSVAAYCRERKNGIRCNSVHPGSIDTPMVEDALETLMDVRLSDTEDRPAFRKQIGIGEPNDVAYMVLYLASDESKHVNGAEMVVDNGDTIV